MSTPELVMLGHSPWSVKARWALGYCKIAFRHTEYNPLLEIWLRWRLWKWSGRVSVPVLFHSEGAITESFEIAEWADDHSQKDHKLFPAAEHKEIAKWDAKSQALLALCRVAFVDNAVTKKGLGEKLLPPILQGLGVITKLFVTLIFKKFIPNKYGDTHAATSPAQCRAHLQELREAIKAGGGYVVGGHFTYADITMSVGLYMLQPMTKPYVTWMPPPIKEAMTAPGWAEDYPDLLAWQDEILRSHFPAELKTGSI